VIICDKYVCGVGDDDAARRFFLGLDAADQFGYGWNAQTNQFGDLYTQGVIDPVKVVRTALQDAASIAGLLVTTEAMVAEKPKKDTPLPAMPGGGMDL
jgi:chaperonin GroEL